MIQLAAVIYTCLVVPYRLAFDESVEPYTSRFWFDAMIDALFLFDIFLSFFAYVRNDQTGVLIKDLAVTRRMYLRGFFIIDFVACFPLDYILMIAGSYKDGEEARNARVLRIMRLIRTARLARILRLMRTSRINALDKMVKAGILRFPWLNVIYKVFVLWVFIFSIAHLVGCLWLHAGVVYAGTEPHGSWIDKRGYVCIPCFVPRRS
jgi:hypothetical protein